MIFNNYPYTDFHEMNLDWIIKMIKELDASMDEFKVINSITFAGKWEITKQYQKWTIVDDGAGNGYISIKAVPIGITLNNTSYWVLVANYSALFAQVQCRIIALEGDITRIDGNITRIDNNIDALETSIDNIKVLNIGRYRINWYSGNAMRVYGSKFNMRGFRYQGMNYKESNKLYTIADSQKDGNNSIVRTSNLSVIDSLQYECWYSIFSTANEDNTCNLTLAPIFRISNVNGNVLTLEATKESVVSTPLTSNLTNVIGMDVLLVTKNGGDIYGEVAKITANTSNTITIDTSHQLAAEDYVVIAPSSDYGYVASHYMDTSEWRNRADDGINVMTKGVSTAYGGLSSGTAYDLKCMNNTCPLATGVYMQGTVTASSSSGGDVAFYGGVDAQHTITTFYTIKTSSTSQSFITPIYNVGYGYRNTVGFCTNAGIPGATNLKVIYTGYIER